MMLLISFLFYSFASPSLCKTGERVIFSCQSKGKKQISVCSSPELGPEKGSLFYRFGKVAKVEMQFPKSKDRGTQDFRWERYTRPAPMATTILSLSFTNADWTYTVFSHSHCEEDNPCEESSGVRLEHKTKSVEVKCIKAPTVNKLWDLEGLIR